MESIIKVLSPSLLLTDRAGEGPVTSQLEIKDPNLSMIFYISLTDST